MLKNEFIGRMLNRYSTAGSKMIFFALTAMDMSKMFIAVQLFSVLCQHEKNATHCNFMLVCFFW
jgi:hypothetical protein